MGSSGSCQAGRPTGWHLRAVRTGFEDTYTSKRAAGVIVLYSVEIVAGSVSALPQLSFLD